MEFFKKHEMLISISLIIIYVILNSYCAQNFGVTDYRAVICNFVFSLIIIAFIVKNKLGEYYGLTKFPKAKEFLYFLPLLLIVLVNFWSGININNTLQEIICYILFMISVGFLEEIIFRGFLFKMMEKDNIKSAIVVSSLTFGIGHIVNLLNGAEVVTTLLQICYAVSVGFLFVTIFQKSKSLWPCIITHAALNALGIFSAQNEISLYIVPIFLIIVSTLYNIYLIKKIK